MMLIVGIFLVCAALVVGLISAAPEGWQDEHGFHLGAPQDGEA